MKLKNVDVKLRNWKESVYVELNRAPTWKKNKRNESKRIVYLTKLKN